MPKRQGKIEGTAKNGKPCLGARSFRSWSQEKRTTGKSASLRLRSWFPTEIRPSTGNMPGKLRKSPQMHFGGEAPGSAVCEVRGGGPVRLRNAPHAVQQTPFIPSSATQKGPEGIGGNREQRKSGGACLRDMESPPKRAVCFPKAMRRRHTSRPQESARAPEHSTCPNPSTPKNQLGLLGLRASEREARRPRSGLPKCRCFSFSRPPAPSAPTQA